MWRSILRYAITCAPAGSYDLPTGAVLIAPTIPITIRPITIAVIAIAVIAIAVIAIAIGAVIGVVIRVAARTQEAVNALKG